MIRSMPVVGISMGDPAGIGPEVILGALEHPDIWRICRPVIFGSVVVLEREGRSRGDKWAFEPTTADTCRESAVATAPGRVLVVESSGDEALIEYGVIDPRGGAAAVAAVRCAAHAALAGWIDAVCTAPLNKEAMHLAGMAYDGHTELLAEIAEVPSVVMMLVGRQLRVAHVTTHSALRRVPDLVTRDRLAFTVSVTHDFLRRLGSVRPRVAVAGLNPHSGENGLFGNEEETVVRPVVEELQDAGLDVVGPVSPDAVFIHALEGRYDAVVVMYHDQGHIPVKLIERDMAVNITGGLPFIRTSVDHGTAFDIAGQSRADATNMVEALTMAARLASGSKEVLG